MARQDIVWLVTVAGGEPGRHLVSGCSAREALAIVAAMRIKVTRATPGDLIAAGRDGVGIARVDKPPAPDEIAGGDTLVVTAANEAPAAADPLGR